MVDPLLSQTAWATLSYSWSITSVVPAFALTVHSDISITQGKNAAQHHWNPLTVEPYDPPSNFADQLSNASSPIFIDSTAPNYIFQLPANATTGIPAFAWSVGVRPQDLFGICLSLFLAILAATIVLSILVWALDFLLSLISGATGSAQVNGLGGTRSPRYSSASKDMLDGVGASATADENRSLNGHALFSRSMSRFPVTRTWWRWRSNFVSFHGSVLQGNLIRILILFHLPITIFSCYQMSLGKGQVSTASIVLAALAFAFFSVLIPAFLVLRLTLTRTSKLYDETWTLLSLGPLYNHYRHGSQLFACTLFAINIAFGVTIGFGQKSGTAQAIVILVVEVAAALGTSIWLPWGQGASMGLISFLFCVGRIVIAVLLVILTPVVSVSRASAIRKLTLPSLSGLHWCRCRAMGRVCDSVHIRHDIPGLPLDVHREGARRHPPYCGRCRLQSESACGRQRPSRYAGSHGLLRPTTSEFEARLPPHGAATFNSCAVATFPAVQDHKPVFFGTAFRAPT